MARRWPVIKPTVHRWHHSPRGATLRSADDARELIVAEGRETFFADRRSQLASESVLHKLGETVARMPDEFTTDHPEVTWRAIKGMRNIVAHEYGEIDYGMVWNALAERLPDDAAAVRRSLGRSPTPGA